jgi:AcrR family transcriptional regulator
MKNGRVNIGSIRRTEIVDAAAAVISEQGIQNLSLSEIEGKVGMSRGQLMYYFKTKEEILLAVFDRMLLLMCEQHGERKPLTPNPSPPGGDGRNWEHPFEKMDWLDVVRHLLDMILQDPPAHPEFHALQYTFLSQISHREDFRRKLAELYEEWRRNMADGLKRNVKKRPAIRKARPRAMATLVQAILHGLAMQKAADPEAIDSREIVHLCLDMLGSYLWQTEPKRMSIAKRKPASQRIRINGNKVLHERNSK